MIYKITTKSGKEIILKNEDAVAQLLAAANSGRVRLIATEYGIVDVSSIDSILPHKEMNHSVGEMLGYRKTMPDGTQQPQYTREEAEQSALGVSPFAKLLGQKMTMLSPKARTAAQEEAALGERAGKRIS